jgi:hypothetical protein
MMNLDQSKHRNPFFERVDENPEYEARKVLQQVGWNGALPIDLLEICEMYGFEVEFVSCPQMQALGTTEFYEEGDFKVIINTYNTDNPSGFSQNQTLYRRQRFTLAHEIGHCIFSSHTNVSLQRNLQNTSNPHSKTYKPIDISRNSLKPLKCRGKNQVIGDV